jgi:predicted nucleotidyltransferase
MEDKINKFINDFCELVYEKLKDKGVKGIGITGSFARGDYSKSRVDINFIVFVEENTPEISLEIGDIISEFDREEYTSLFNFRPEFHPERFAHPWETDRNKKDLFFKIAIFDLRDKNLERPFGRPSYVLEGHKLSIKIIKGDNCLEDIVIDTNNQEILDGVRGALKQWQRKLRLAPLAYNFNKDIDLFFNECLSWGKIVIMQYAWAQGIKNGLDYTKEEDRLKIFEVINNKEALRDFIKLDPSVKEYIDLILDSRNNYEEWKEDINIAKKLYIASANLTSLFLRNLR